MRFSKIVALALWFGVLSLSWNAFAAPHGKREVAQGGRIERFCDKVQDPARRELRLTRLAERLHLTDAQKELFKAAQGARAAAWNPAVEAICAGKTDVKSFEGKLAFRQRVLEARLNGMKASSDKLVAFYNALDNGQKAVFDYTRRRHQWHHHVGYGDENGREWDGVPRPSRDDR
ncbi:hypothetical protein M2322_004160 [Rhodoblastus acidophilus]|uniref:Spy/CpxP family protein refolding chaperone n=1 Tax=Rhodoblastus acidophilus TaxID=1074 RepID=UPI0022256D4B|nr:Spy/CpxP family protein refolding chaperone [Rhodoblastus acidophilus]MCW2318591.1 hypothetical protein [Rhodoblastus acidophilus]